MKLLQRLFSGQALVEIGALRTLIQTHRALTDNMAEHPVFKRMREQFKPQMEMAGDIAIIPVQGILAKKPDVYELMFGIEDSDSIVAMMESAEANDSIKGVLLDIDSPGGFATSLDAADAVSHLRRKKPVVAYTGNMMASLAYYLGSRASEVVASRNALAGSIGVYSAHVDLSKLYDAEGVAIEVFKNKEGDLKAAGFMGTTLTDAQRDDIRERVQYLFDDFKSAVRANRPGVPDEAMRGQTFYGSEAKQMKLVDRLGDRHYALSVLHSQLRQLN